MKLNRVAEEQYTSASLPARGVWIEIMMVRLPRIGVLVAPRKGSVD